MTRENIRHIIVGIIEIFIVVLGVTECSGRNFGSHNKYILYYV